MAQEVVMYLSFTIAIAALVTILGRLIRQPPIIAYLIAGVIVGPLALNFIGPASPSADIIQIFAHIGVAFLLFIVGLSLDFRVFKEVGGVASLGGILEIVITALIGALIALGLGFSSTTILYLATALAFSSTVVVVKLLSDKKEIDTLHGRIALGILIVEDFIAALALMAVPLVQSGGSIAAIASKLVVIIALIALVLLFATFILSRLLNYLAQNQEVLFLFGIGWALSIATLFDMLGFSLEIGALIAGMSLASTKYTLDLGGKMKPLRDFFVVLFFVFFGSQLNTTLSPTLIKQALIFSVFIIIGKPIIVMSVLRFFGYKKRTNFLTGTSLAQISEFSLILALLGFTLGHLSQEVMSLVVLISIITIGTSSYSIYYAHTIFERISRFLTFFESKKHRTLTARSEERYEVILFGYHRLGYKILQAIQKMKVKYLVIDHNPKVMFALSKEGINCIYGDATDLDFLSQIGLEHAKMVISTIPDEAANLNIQKWLQKTNPSVLCIATAEQPRVALDLYQKGVDYVIIPHHLGGLYAADMIHQFKMDKKRYSRAGKSHAHTLQKGKKSSNFTQ